jgi:membrane-associated phospholipid phosphatase
MRNLRRFCASLLFLSCLQFGLYPAVAAAEESASEQEIPPSPGSVPTQATLSTESGTPTEASAAATGASPAPASPSTTASTTASTTEAAPPLKLRPGTAGTLPTPTWSPKWGRPGWLNVGLTAAMTAGAVGMNLGIEPPEEPGWRGPILLDRFMHDTLGATTPHGMSLADGTSDVLLASLVGIPLLVEPTLTWLTTDDATAAGRMALINMQSLALTFFATSAIKYTVGRERPPLGECWDDPNANASCDERNTLSFPSGHTSMAFAGAGLICLNHEVLSPLGGAWDDVACYTALSAATATGVLRMAANKHYMTDVVAGAAIGIAAGYFLPKWLYFGFDGEGGLLADQDVMVTPSVGEVNGISVSFTW